MKNRKLNEKFAELVDVAERLRGPAGCPWDKEQTAESLKTYLLEEAYELLSAIDNGETESIKEEMGDLLFQIVFFSQVYSEHFKFKIEDVLEVIIKKLIRRHPHVFGNASFKDSKEVLANWERLKAKERKKTGKKSILDGVPPNIPALLRAFRLGAKAARVGFDWEKVDDVVEKMSEELHEFARAVKGNRRNEMVEELGDILFVICNLARKIHLDPEDALRQANEKFVRRFRFVEGKLAEKGKDVTTATLKEMELLWNRSKVKVT